MIGKIIAGLVGLVLIAGLISVGKLWEVNNTDSILVVQAPWTGNISVYTSSGSKWQGWGKVTHYYKSALLNFNPKDGAPPIKVRFAEGGHGDVAGSCRFDLPLDYNKMVDIHQTFGSQTAVERQLIRTTVERSMYMTGPLMTSSESFSIRRPDMINLFEDQAVHGVFQTVQTSKEIDDPLTGQKKWVSMVDLKKDKDGNVLRQEESPLVRFGVRLYNIAIVAIDYEKIVEDQIAQQQQATIAVQIAIANSRKAEQDVLTTVKQGEANAASAKWTQEALKSTAVTKAEQEQVVAETNARRDKKVAELAAERDKNVADLQRQAAEFTKSQQIALGQGEAERKKLAMAANGALEQKLAAYVEVQKSYANALSNFRGNIVPGVITGGGTGNNPSTANGFSSFMELLSAKAATDLSVDMKMRATEAAANRQ